MLEFYQYQKEKNRENRGTANIRLAQSKISDEVDLLLQKYLVDNIKELVFEVNEKSVEHLIEVVDKPPLSEKYIIIQQDKTLFKAVFRTIEL